MNRIDLIPFLQNNELTKELSLDELKDLLPFLEIYEYNEGEMIFEEGDESKDLYLVIKGKLVILKKMDDQFQDFGSISDGQFFGEMAHLEGEKRSAGVKALESVQVLSIHLDQLQQTEDNKVLYSKIIAQIAKKVSGNLRKTDQTLIDSLREKLEFTQAHNQISKTLIHLIILIAIWFNLYDFAELFPAHRATLDFIFTSLLLILFAVSALIVIRSSGYPLLFYGLTLQGWLPKTIEAILYSIPLMILVLIVKWLLIHNLQMYKNLSIFASASTLKASLFGIVVYVVFSPVQEIVARGCIQSCFRNFFQGPNRVFLAILTSNLLFQVLHTAKDFWLAFVSLFFGFFWGFLFEAQKSVVGVSVSHAIIGVWSIFILDFISIFDLARAL